MQRSVWADCRLCREQTVVVVDHLECQCLPRLVGGPCADRGGPAVDNLEANIFIDGLAGPLDEGGRIVHSIDCDREGLRRAGIEPSIGCATVVSGDDGNMSYTVGIWSGRKSERASW